MIHNSSAPTPPTRIMTSTSCRATIVCDAFASTAYTDEVAHLLDICEYRLGLVVELDTPVCREIIADCRKKIHFMRSVRITEKTVYEFVVDAREIESELDVMRMSAEVESKGGGAYPLVRPDTELRERLGDTDEVPPPPFPIDSFTWKSFHSKYHQCAEEMIHRESVRTFALVYSAVIHLRVQQRVCVYVRSPRFLLDIGRAEGVVPPLPKLH